jgi:hypothetical protein
VTMHGSFFEEITTSVPISSSWVSIPSSPYKVVLRPILLGVREVDNLAILDYRLPFLDPGFYLLSRGKEVKDLILSS